MLWYWPRIGVVVVVVLVSGFNAFCFNSCFYLLKKNKTETKFIVRRKWNRKKPQHHQLYFVIHLFNHPEAFHSSLSLGSRDLNSFYLSFLFGILVFWFIHSNRTIMSYCWQLNIYSHFKKDKYQMQIIFISLNHYIRWY